MAALNASTPTGTWSLYLVDDCEVDTVSLTSWSLTITTAGGPTTLSSSPGAISVPDCCQPTKASPYASTASVSGIPAPDHVSGLTVTLTGLTHGYAADLNALLVGPGGQKALLMSDVGRNAAGVDLTFSDSAGAPLPASGNLVTGTYTPTDGAEECAVGGSSDPFPAPAPAGPYGTSLSVFNGLTGSDVNGTWSLYLVDDCGANAGSMTGWSLNIAHNPTSVVVSSFMAARQAKGVTVRWRTAVEANLLGFNVFRNGLKLNKYLVQARNKTRGASYSYTDRTAKVGRVYSYRLQAVGIDGSKRWRGSARVLAKTRSVRSLARVSTSLDFVCSLQKNGSLRYVTNTSQCRKKESGVTVSPGPVHLCYQADNSVRQVASQAACLAPGTYLKLPPLSADAFFCADADGRLTREAAAGNCGAATEVFSQHTDDPPTDIGLSPSSVAENQPANTTVGTLSSTDPNVGDTFTYTLVAGTGSTDNASFNISGSSLRSSASFNFEVKSSYSIRVRSTDAGGLFFEKVFTVSVTDVNETPTDIALSSSAVDENQAINTTVGTLSTTDPDTGQTFTYTLVAGTGSTDNASFNISGNALRTSAVFDFETKSSYSIRLRTTDSGTGNLFFEKVFTISVNNVNEPPVNTVPGAQAVNEDTNLAFSGGSALSIADPDAGTNAVKVSLDVLHGTLTLGTTTGLTFVDATANGTASVHFTGTIANINTDLATLVYKGTLNYNSTRGAETLTMVTNDQGNTGSGGAKSDTDTVGITVNAVNDPPTAAIYNPGANAVQANMKRSGQFTLPLASATDPDTGDGGYTAAFTVGTVSATTPPGGSVTVTNSSTGAFDFDPPPGATGNVTFTYAVCDSGNPAPPQCSAAATVTINVAGPVIWFVNSALGSNGTGTLASPFNVLSAADAVDAASQGIFLYSSATSYTGALTLNATEKLIGQATTGTTFDSVFGISPPTGTTARPTLAGGAVTMTGTLTLASTNTLRGLALSTGASAGLVGSGGLTGEDVDQASVTTSTGTAVNLNNAAGTYVFSSVSTNGAANGILLDTLGSSNVTVSGGTIVNASTRGVDINSGTGNYTFANTITTSATGRSVEVTSHTGGTIAFNGAITDSGLGINLGTGGGNTGATINFTGGITNSTGTNGAFNATGGGTVNVTGSNNTLVSTTGTALNVDSTTIGSSNLNFKSIAANGAVNGIKLNATGASGHLAVTGNGSVAQGGDNSGGTIQNTTGDAILLNSTNSPSFNNMNIQSPAGNGVFGTNSVANFSFTNGKINNAGDASGESCGSFSTVNAVNVTGTFAFSNSQCTLTEAEGIDIKNYGGTLSDVNISNNVLSDTGDVATPGSAVVLTTNALSAASPSAILKAELSNNTITDFRAGAGFVVQANSDSTGVANMTLGQTASGTNVINITGNFMDGGNGGIGNQPDRFITGGVNGTGQGNFNISNNGNAGNRIRHIDGVVVEITAFGPANVKLTADNNFIDANNAVSSSGFGIGVTTDSFPTTDNGSLTATVTNNNIMGTNGQGIFAVANGSGNVGTLNVGIRNNTIAAPTTGSYGIQVSSGSSGTTVTTCTEISGNTTAGGTNIATSTTFPGIGLRRQAGNVFGIEGMAATSTPGVENYVNSLNTSASGTFGTGGTALVSATSGFSNCSSAP
jgi:subtilisin-like proprotein convertase family protein